MAVDSTTTIEYKIVISDKTKKPLDESKKSATELSKIFGSMGNNSASAFSKMQAGIIAFNQGIDLMGRAIRGVKGLFDGMYGSSIQLERGVAGISTLFDSTSASTKAITADIIQLQRRFGTDQQDAIKAYYEAIASGAVSVSDAMKLMIDAEKLAIGGMTSLQTAVDGLTGIISAFGLAASDAVKVNDALFIGAAAGKTNIDELVSSLGQASAFAKATGVTFQELIASVSALTAGGVQTAEAVTQVRSAMVGLSKQTEELSEVLYKLNITSIKNEISQNGLVETLRKIIGQTDGSIESLTKLFGRVEAVNAVLALTNNSVGKKYIDIMDDMGKKSKNAGEVTEKAFQKMANTVDFKINQIKARLSTFFSKGNIDEMFNPILDSLNSMITLFEKLRNVMQGIDFEKMATSLLKLSVAIGLVTVGFSAWATVMSAGSILVAIKYVAELGLIMAKDLVIYAAVALKWLAIATAITLTVAALDVLIRNIGNLGNLWKTIVTGFEYGVAKIKQAFSILFIQMAKGSLFLSEMMDKVGIKTNKTIEDQKAYIQSLEEEYSNLAEESESVFDKFSEAADKIDKGFFGDMFDMATKAMKDFGKQLDSVGAKQVTAPKIGMPQAQEQVTTAPGFKMPELITSESMKLISNTLGDTFAGFAGSLSGIFSTAVLGFAGAANIILDVIKAIIEFIPNILNKVADIISMFAELPLKIIDALKNINKAVFKLIEEFIPNLVNTVFESLDIGEQLPEQIIGAFMKLFEKLPDMMVKFVMIFFRSLFTTIPRIVVNIIQGLIKAIPALVNAIGKGLTKVFEEVPKMLGDAFKGIINDIAKIFNLAPPFKLDMKDTIDKVEALGDKISKSASDIFSVSELQGEGRGMDIADRIRNAIVSSAGKARDILTKWWSELEKLWRRFWDENIKHITKIWDNLVSIWRTVWDITITSITKTWDLIVAIWRNTWDLTIMAVTATWDLIVKIWRTTWDVTISTLTYTWNLLVEIWRKTWEITISSITTTWNIIVALWRAIWDTTISSVTGSWSGIVDTWRKLWDGTVSTLTKAWETIVDLFSKFKMPEFNWPSMPTFNWPSIPKPSWWNLSTGGFVLPSSGSVMNKVSSDYKRSDIGQATTAIGNRLKFESGGIVPTGRIMAGRLYAQGGAIAQGTDVVPAQLTPGEFVVNREAARSNLGLLSFMNTVKAPVAPHTPTNNFSIVINAKTDLSAEQIRREVIPTLERELKKKSQEGKFIIATSGLRTNK